MFWLKKCISTSPRCAVKSFIDGKKAYGGAILRVPEPDAWGLCSQIEETSFVPKFTAPPIHVGGPWGVRVDPVIHAGSTLIGGSRFPPRPPLVVDPHGYVDPPAGCQERATQGQEYEGHMSKTDTGRTCQRWTSSKPHKPSKTYRSLQPYSHTVCPAPQAIQAIQECGGAQFLQEPIKQHAAKKPNPTGTLHVGGYESLQD